MKPLVSAGIAALLALAAFAARAEVLVQFMDPEKFADAGDPGAERRANLDQLAAHLRSLGDRYLRAGETLRIEVIDIDLAGRKRMSRRATSEVRVATGGADWPTIRLRYALEANGKVVRTAEETVSDMDYLRHTPPAHQNDSLAYEKAMLDEWFRNRFAKTP